MIEECAPDQWHTDMTKRLIFSESAGRSLIYKEPFLWLNHGWLPRENLPSMSELGLNHVHYAEARWNRCAALLTQLFPELFSSAGIIESPLCRTAKLQAAMQPGRRDGGRWLIKADHALPVAGSIKARGGIYEVLVHAETLAHRHGLTTGEDDALCLASVAARKLFSRHQVAVGSTGNLGLSVGIMAAALGFRATVHMSCDAKPWKKARLRARGVEAVEHDGDFSVAVAAGRAQALASPDTYFVDDENSRHLFLGYSVAALRLARQISEHQIAIDARHPLFVYLPCGVGGAPGGITFGLRHLLGDHVHCFFAEPTASPSMLIRLASKDDAPISVRDVGLDNRTEADGLAVGQASEFVAPLMRPLVSGVFTVPDSDLFEDLYMLEQTEGLRIEPSAAAGFRGPRWLLESEAGHQYLANHGLRENLHEATHVLWTTGGSFVPDDEYRRFHERGRQIVEGVSPRLFL
jgi:D-serine dehydratase